MWLQRSRQIRRDFRALQTDLQSSNLAAAQSDFATLLKDAPQLSSQLQSGPSATGTATTSQSSALSALSTSLQAGDIGGAQTALASLGQSFGGAQTAANSMGHVHRHHHHHHHDEDSAPSNSAASGGSQAIQSDFQALSSALQSGNIASAQQALAQLQKDDPQLASNANPTAPLATAVA